MASKEEVTDIMQCVKDGGNYVATIPLVTMKCNLGGLSSSLEECLDKEYISHGCAIDKGKCILGCIFHGVLKSYVKQVSSLFAQFVLHLQEKATIKQSSEQIFTLGNLRDSITYKRVITRHVKSNVDGRCVDHIRMNPYKLERIKCKVLESCQLIFKGHCCGTS